MILWADRLLSIFTRFATVSDFGLSFSWGKVSHGSNSTAEPIPRYVSSSSIISVALRDEEQTTSRGEVNERWASKSPVAEGMAAKC